MKIRALITRPHEKGEQLARQIEAANGAALCCPFIDISAGQQFDKVSPLLENLQSDDYIIAISDNAVNYANASLILDNKAWPQQINYIAVGPTTAKSWQKYGIRHAKIPDSHDSEGVLKLFANVSLANKNIVILRGNGGRETMAEDLRRRTANVTYCEVYQRTVPDYDQEMLINKWQQFAINSVIITSGEILGNLIKTIPYTALPWILNLHFIVPSPRIAALAHELGIAHVTIASGASNNSLFNAVKQLDMQIGIS
ncbi:uroporphyrinogen-III synthase [Moritella sp. Urea-trap-13]|uniref:uroporphyrinogen-III synthase n=1 Tax=Moritella sp. Urea-trap-13 TaxID=2058327 RepID=UPI000C3230AB|nr:uroporphyrinogen-III synthase [Moritella sp. Urea-trap-13]PKH07642.1 uroporphyrinogen-III synthase [Moritella sp. Urea-trap-13]